MSERKGFKPMLAALAANLGLFKDPLALPPQAGRMPRRTRKTHNEPRYKKAFSMGFRGFPKGLTPVGGIPAPTIDQVRQLERKYKTRLHAKMGLIYFKTDGRLFDAQEAEARMA